MKTNESRDGTRQPLEESLLIEDQRRPISIAEHEAWRESISAPAPADPLDDLVAASNREESP